MFRSFALLAATAIAFVASEDGYGFGKPLIGTDSMKNLHLNTSQRVLVNGKDLMTTVQLIQDLGIEVAFLRQRLAAHTHITRSPSPSPTTPEPTASPTIPAPTITPTTAQPSPPTPYGIKYNGVVYDSPNQTFTIQNTNRNVKTITVFGSMDIIIEAAGAGGGRGMWNNDNAIGAPGGTIKIKTTLSFTEPTDLYAFVSEMGVSKAGLAGAGGGSSDLRTNFKMPVGSNGQDKAFLDAFLSNASLNSRIIVGGGGGGSHGGSYGYWGDATKSPGAGGPTKTCTNTKGSNDGGFVEAGASVTQAGQDGGQSINSQYTGPGRFGMGGQASDGSQYAIYTTSNSRYTGMTWPNGGSGTKWANGGGGGGWYGGAGNWPNGGGGSNYAPDIGDIVANSCASNAGAGYLRITIVGHN